MPTRFTHDDAARLAGDVFGEILLRESDPEGYAYVLDCLESGTKSLQQIVVEFITSDEFIDRFVARELPGSTVNLINVFLLGAPLDSEQDTLIAQRVLIRQGLQHYAEQIIKSEDYQRRIGPDGIPSMKGVPWVAAEDDAFRKRPARRKRAAAG